MQIERAKFTGKAPPWPVKWRDPKNLQSSQTLHTLDKAARSLGKRLRLTLV